MLMRHAGTAFAACMLALSLAGCESMSDFTIDPGEWFSGDFLSSKKKLPGERKPVFPDGVPGVSKGIPPELVKGYQPGSDADQDNSLAQKVTGDDQPKAKPKAKPKPKVAATAKPAAAESPSRPTPITVRRSDAQAGQSNQQQPSAEQWPDPTPPGQQSGAAQWPDPPRPATGGGVQWPDPPQSR
jgi:hypothetical protein